jgi:hypothetical protein
MCNGISCNICKPLNEFYTRGRNIKRPECKECTKSNHKESRKQGIEKKYRNKVKLEVLTHYSHTKIPKCKGCGVKEIAILTLDHIYDNGAEDRRKAKINGGHKTYSYLRKNNYPNGFQVLCWNCQWRKRQGVPFPIEVKNHL